MIVFLFRWIRQSSTKRKKFIYQLLLSIRWMSFTAEYIENVVARNNFVQTCKDAKWVFNQMNEISPNLLQS